MKLETSRELLERVRAQHKSSWWGLSKVIPASESTVNNWKHGRSAIGREYVTRIAELLGEPAEYVLACVEHEREQDAGAKKLWRRIAERFHSTASILLVALGLFAVPRGASATELDVGVGRELSNQQLIHYAQLRGTLRRRLAKLLRCLKSQSPGPLAPPWARICSMAWAPSRSPA